MNERIRELAMLAGGQGLVVRDFIDTEKFAELIIRECAKQVKDFYQETEFTCYGAETEILSHFGLDN
jgi:hypothetical protein